MNQFLIVSNEPSPYMVDLYNALGEEAPWPLLVYFPKVRDWGPDSGHNYQILPSQNYEYKVNEGRTIFNKLAVIVDVCRLIWKKPPLVMINGYSSLVHVNSLIMCYLFNIPFLFFGDYFNVPPPKNILLRIFRKYLRFIVFNKSVGVLTCGKMGVESALKSGCKIDKILDFPYVIDKDRLSRLAYEFEHKYGCDIKKNWPLDKIIILFSGRMIERKGLDTLLEALFLVKKQGSTFFLIIEGDGPLFHYYERKVKDMGLWDSIAMLGFCQMDKHAWLLSISDIVVVPSFYDPWGLAVPESMLMGKAVIASNVVGSAVHHIEHNKNGLLFNAGDEKGLASAVSKLIINEELRKQLAISGQKSALLYSPKRNADILFAFLKQQSIC